MSYLSCENTPFVNFMHLAYNTATMTEEYEEALKEIKQEEFPGKVRALEITAIAILALGIFVAAFKLISGIILASLAVIPLIALKYQIDKQAVLLSKIEEKAYEINEIINDIYHDLKERQDHKENSLIDLFNHTSPHYYFSADEQKAKQQVQDYANLYDEANLKFQQAKDDSKCQQYIQAIPPAQEILNRNAPPTLPADQWNKLQKASFVFLHGEGSINAEQIWVKDASYVELEMEPEQHTWVAKKYSTASNE